MSRKPQCTVVIACLCAVAASANAHGETTERDWPHTGNGSVTLENPHGHVEVIGWAEPRVQLRAALGAHARLVVVRASNTRLQLAVVVDDSANVGTRSDASLPSASTGSRLVLRVPHGVALTVTGVSADVDVRGIRNASMIAISTVSGDQHIAGTARAVRLKSVSGDLGVRGASAKTAATTISGDVELHDFVGGAAVTVVSGNVRISNATLGVLDLDSVSGNVDIAATPLRDARWNIESLGGDVDLRNLELDQVAITADTFSGVIEMGSGRTQRGTATAADRRPSQLRLNPRSAHAHIVVESFSGDIRLHRQP